MRVKYRKVVSCLGEDGLLRAGGGVDLYAFNTLDESDYSRERPLEQ